MGELSIFIFGVPKPNIYQRIFFCHDASSRGPSILDKFRRKMLSRAQRKRFLNYVGSNTCNGQPQ